jgi:hypothetical protein
MEKSNLVEENLKTSFGIHSWIEQRLDGLDIPKKSRSLISVGCHDVVIEHHCGISLLIKSKIYASAFALVRPLFETFVRGVWLKNCASDDELKKFNDDSLNKKFGVLLRDIEKLDGFSSKVLSHLKEQAWSEMCGFTHGGIQQIGRRVLNNEIFPDFRESEIVEVLRLTQAFSLLSFIQIVGEADRVDLANEAGVLLYKLNLFVRKDEA